MGNATASAAGVRQSVFVIDKSYRNLAVAWAGAAAKAGGANSGRSNTTGNAAALATGDAHCPAFAAKRQTASPAHLWRARDDDALVRPLRAGFTQQADREPADQQGATDQQGPEQPLFPVARGGGRL